MTALIGEYNPDDAGESLIIALFPALLIVARLLRPEHRHTIREDFFRRQRLCCSLMEDDSHEFNSNSFLTDRTAFFPGA